jgi:FkbM family methyltransferase
LVERGAPAGAPASYGGLTRAARRLASRLNRHALLHQREVDRALLGAIEEVAAQAAAGLSELTGRVDATERRLIEVEVLAARQGWPAPAADAAAWRSRLAAPLARPDGQPRGAVRVETDVGPLLVPEHDRVIHHVLRDTGVWEEEEADALRSLLAPGMTFVDIGAHVGYMSLVAAGVVGPRGRGIALEPAPGNFELLHANLARNRASNVVAIPAAAWKETGPVTFSLDEFNTGDHRAYSRAGAETVEVQGYALDDLIPEELTVHVVKVDAQGTDHLALQGMARTLARCRPTLVVEYWPPGITELGDDPLAVLDGYRALGFEIAVLGVEQVRPQTSLEGILEVARASHGSFCNLLLRPPA